MLVADAVIGMADLFDRKLAVPGRYWDELAAGKFLRRPALVGVNVGSFAADHRMISVGQRFEAKAIRRGAVEHHEHFYIRAEMLLELANGRLSVWVIPVSDGVAVVRG